MSFDMEQLEFITDQAIDASGKFATPDWYEQAFICIQQLCKLGSTFTTDDVWLRLKDTGLQTPEPRAIGSVIRQAAKEGWIRSTGQYKKSLRPECHRRPVLIWEPV